MLNPKDLDRALDRLIGKEKIEEPSDLLEAAEAITRLDSLEPRAQRRAELKGQFLARGRELASSGQRLKKAPLKRLRLLTVRKIAAVASVLILSSGSVVYAAAGSMPNSPLYPVKRAGEAIALSVTSGKTQKHLEEVFAAKRLKEARHLLKSSEPAAARSQAINLLNEARKSGDPGLKNKVDDLLEEVGNKALKKKTTSRSNSNRGQKRSDQGGPSVSHDNQGPPARDLLKAGPGKGPKNRP